MIEKVYRIRVAQREGFPVKRYYPEVAISKDINGRYYQGRELKWDKIGGDNIICYERDLEAVQHIEKCIIDDEYKTVEIINYPNNEEL